MGRGLLNDPGGILTSEKQLDRSRLDVHEFNHGPVTAHSGDRNLSTRCTLLGSNVTFLVFLSVFDAAGRLSPRVLKH